MPKKKTVKKNPKKQVHPISGLTPVQETQRCKAALRQVWRKTSRWKHIREVRVPHPDPNSKFKYAVYCSKCGEPFGQTQKIIYMTKSGRRRRTGAYHVNHICEQGMPSVTNIIEDLGGFADKLLHTPVEVVCVPCHADITAEQSHVKYGKD